MTRRVLLLVLAATALVTLSGCIPGAGPGPGPGPDEAAIMDAVGDVLATFEDSVELYDVDGMLGCLANPDFTLTLVEATVQPPITLPTKSYGELEDELLADEAPNLVWRKPTAEGGRGYVLDLQLGAATFSGITAGSARVTQTFSVEESADGVGPKVTDQGTIAWQFAKISGEWVAMSMTITFEAVARAASTNARTSSPGRNSFGFGRLVL